MSQKTATPWLSSYGNLPHTLNYSEKSMSAAVLDTAAREKDFIALSFNGRKIPFAEMAVNIERTAKAFYHMGVRPGSRVLVCLPNVPQAIYCLYGLNRIGAVAAMVHPLSAVGEIVQYINEASCDYAVTLDQFYHKFENIFRFHCISNSYFLFHFLWYHKLRRIRSIFYKFLILHLKIYSLSPLLI
mgnify:CR=1 FL=1